VRVFMDRNWTEWLPIFAWVIEHPEGVIVVDTGETARTSEPGYLPRWHPYYRLAVGFDVKPAEEIGPQLRKLGIAPEDVGTVIMTHLHTDHAGGLHHFPRSKIFRFGSRVSEGAWSAGQVEGLPPASLAEWFAPVPIPFKPAAFWFVCPELPGHGCRRCGGGADSGTYGPISLRDREDRWARFLPGRRRDLHGRTTSGTTLGRNQPKR